MIPTASTRVAGTAQGIVLLLPITLAVMGLTVLVPVVPQIMDDYKGLPGAAYLVQAGVLTMPALCIMLFSAPAGWLADRVGRRRLLIGAMIAYAFLGMAPVILRDIYAIIASRVGVGMCEAIVVTSSTTMISDYFDGRARERWLGNQAALGSLCSIVMIAIGGALGSVFGWHGVFAIYGLSLPLAFLVWRYTWEPDSDEHEAQRHTDADSAPVLFPWRRLLGICAITLFASIMFYTLLTQNAFALNALGVVDPAQIGIFTAVATLGVPAGTFAFRRLSHLPVAALLFIEFGAVAVGFLGMGTAPRPVIYVAAALINQFGCGMILPTLLTWATAGLPFEVRGRGNGLWQASFAIGQFLTVIVVFLVAQLGGIQSAFIALAAGNALFALVALVLLARYRGTIAAADSNQAALV